MDKKKKFFSLKLQMLCVLVLAGLLAYGAYMLSNYVGYKAVEKRYMTQDASQARVRSYMAEFQSYVKKNNIKSDDINSIASWTMNKKYVHILIYRRNKPQMEAGNWGADYLAGTNTEKYYEAMTDTYVFSPITFSDGTFRISLDEYTYAKYYTLADIVSIIIAFAVLLITVLFYVSRTARRISRLSSAAREIEGGDLEYPICETGKDEISLLASGMNSMRLSVSERIKSETAARQANVDLIGAMSHDIRTPLTTLIGYLELLQGKTYATDEQRDSYTTAAHEKAMRLKELTDELFRYFIVYDNPDLPLDIQEFDSGILLEQLLGENIMELRDSGVHVIVNNQDRPCTILADVMSLKRVLENVISNVNKHGDLAKPVVFMSQLERDGRMHVTVTNSIPPTPNKVESTKMGLKSCEKMMKSAGGEFITVHENDKFMAEIVIPVKAM